MPTWMLLSVLLAVPAGAAPDGPVRPSDALELADDPVPAVAPAPPAADDDATPGERRGGSMPTGLGALGALGAVLAIGGAGRARRDEDPIFVLASGYGSESAEDVFADLIVMMELDPDDVALFDYRFAHGASDHSHASRRASVDDVADAMHGFLAGVAAGSGRPVFVVAFSKSAAATAELVARWDDGVAPVDGVIGVVLLEPPMATGIHGALQSLGARWGMLPNDGGYDPVDCAIGFLGCSDDRAHLGVASGVEVAVVINPRAGLTNMADTPEGLRVYAAADDGPGFWNMLLRPWALPGRVSEAHDAVLHDPRVAECILNEAELAGSCGLPRVDRPPGPLVWAGGRPSFGAARNRAL